MDCFNNIVKKRIPTGPPTRWYLQECTVSVIYENKEALLECFEYIRDTEVSYAKTTQQAAGFVSFK